MKILNYKDKEIRETLRHFEQLLEEAQESGEAMDYTIETNDYGVQGALLETIDRHDLDHKIQLGGRVIVTIPNLENPNE